MDYKIDISILMQLQFATGFFIVVYSLITLVHVLIKFKKPFNVKLLFIVIISLIGFSNYLNFTKLDFYTFKIINYCVKAIFTISFLQLITRLFFISYLRLVNIISLLIFLFSISSIILIATNNYPVFSTNRFIYFNKISPYTEGIKVPLFINICRLILGVTYIGTILYFCYQIIVNFNHRNIYFKKIKMFAYGIITYIFFLILYFLLRQFFNQKHQLLNIIISFSLDFLLLITIYNRPEFLDKSSYKIRLIYTFMPSQYSKVDSTKFIDLFFNQSYYLNKDAGIRSFAKLLDVKSDDISFYVQNEFGMDFEELLNKHRIEYFIELVRNPSYRQFTIDSLAKESGFVSRNAFYKPFKKFHGGNPSDLIDFYS